MKNEKKPDIATTSLIGLAFDLGFLIAIPIIVLAVLGRFADIRFGTTPWLMLGTILLSMVISSAIVYKKVSKLF